jgi:hypothetical protein
MHSGAEKVGMSDYLCRPVFHALPDSGHDIRLAEFQIRRSDAAVRTVGVNGFMEQLADNVYIVRLFFGAAVSDKNYVFH